MKRPKQTLIALVLLAVAACRNHDLADLQPMQDAAPDSLFIELTIDVAGDRGGTRAVPNGGEEGDGWEYGLARENRLHNFTVFVIGRGEDINSASAATAFVGSRYVTDEEVARVDSLREYGLLLKDYDPAVLKDVLTYQLAIPIMTGSGALPPEPYRFIVVANDGDLTRLRTVGQLRQAMPVKTWSGGTATEPLHTRFVMCNENDGSHASGVGTAANPVRLHVSIERLAARIDFLPRGAEPTADGLRYAVSPPATAGVGPLAYLYADRMVIVNGCRHQASPSLPSAMATAARLASSGARRPATASWQARTSRHSSSAASARAYPWSTRSLAAWQPASTAFNTSRH